MGSVGSYICDGDSLSCDCGESNRHPDQLSTTFARFAVYLDWPHVAEDTSYAFCVVFGDIGLASVEMA